MHLDTWRWFFIHLKPYRVNVIGLILVSVAFGLIDIATPLILQKLVDAAGTGTFDLFLTVTLIVLFLASSVPVPYWIRSRLRNRFMHKLRGDLLTSLLQMDISFHDGRGSSELTSQVGKGVGAAGNLLNLITSSDGLLQLPVAIFAIYYLGQHSLPAVAVLIGFLTVFGICSTALGKRVTAEELAFNKIDNKLSARTRESIHHIDTVRICDTQVQEINHYWREGGRALKRRLALTNLYAGFNLLGSGARDFATAVAVVFFIPQVVRGEISIGTFFALLMFATRIVGPAEFFGQLYAEIKEAGAKLQPVMEILAVKPTITERANPVAIQPITHSVTLNDVWFGYPGSERSILKGLSLTIPAGKMTAIVGESGVGKSTIARLLARLYEPSSGTIRYDGANVRDSSFASLYQEIVYLDQEVTIFSGTIWENVTYGVTNPTKDAVDEAIRKACATFVYDLELGLDTEIGELGMKLSRGQRQRLTIARAHLRNPSVVILDEATSALDNQTERLVNQGFLELSKNRTMIVIAHRLSTVVNADQIVVMDDGQVLAVGRHDELLKHCPVYHRLYTSPTEAQT